MSMSFKSATSGGGLLKSMILPKKKKSKLDLNGSFKKVTLNTKSGIGSLKGLGKFQMFDKVVDEKEAFKIMQKKLKRLKEER